MLTFGGLQRTYVLHVPPAPQFGLVINLHGSGMTGADQAADRKSTRLNSSH